MVFSSFAFIAGFMPLALVGYLLCARLGPRFAALWLVLASLGFYAYWRVSFLPLLLISIAFNFSVSLVLVRTNERPRLQNAVLLFGVAADLLALVYYKYVAALADRWDSAAWAALRCIISSCRWAFRSSPSRRLAIWSTASRAWPRIAGLLDYMLFVTFFPHLIAGPILHNRRDDAAIRRAGDVSRSRAENLSVGLAIFVIGLAKKVLLADPVRAVVPVGFRAPRRAARCSPRGTSRSAYSLQLYFDFSGYSDMAIGLARMFNVRFPLNFNSPYKATSVIDYWQRWHMTLTRYLMMYLYTPIAISVARWRRGARACDTSRAAYRTPGGFAALVLLPIFVTIGLAGIWHGAGAQFLLFGLLHALYLTVNHTMRIFYPAPRPRRRGRGWSGPQSM